MTYPLTMTWAELAELPDAMDCFGWDYSMLDPDDDDTTLVSTIAYYSEAFTSSEKLAIYLGMIGYNLTTDDNGRFTGITVRSDTALSTAHALFSQIMHEYDELDCPRVHVERYGHPWESTPTWALFELGGDDDVDYCGSQPSCLTDLLIRHVNMGTEA